MRTRFAVASLALGSVLLGVAFLLLHLLTPFDDARLAPGLPDWRPDGVVVTPLQESPAGLRPGDVVVAVDGKSLESWAQALLDPGRARPNWRIGQTVTYTVLRAGQQIQVPVTLESYPLGTILLNEWSTVLFALVFLLVAVFVFLRRPDDRAAQVQLLIGASITGATTWSLGLQVSDLVNGLGFWLYAVTTYGVYTLFWVGILHFALVFPEPHPLIVRRPWTILLLYLAPYTLFFAYLASVWPGAASTLDWIGHWDVIESVLPTAYLLLTIAVEIWNYRTLHTTAARQKFRWLIFAGLVCAASTFFLWYLPPLILGQPLLDANGLGLLVLPYPLILPIAILRYRLFDIDIILNRTLVYGILTVIVVGVYILVVSLLGIVWQTSGNALGSLLATGLIAVLFQPLRLRLQRVVNRLMYGERDDPYAVLSRLGRRLEATLAPEAVLPTIVETVAQALKLPYSAIALKQSEGFIPAASYGLPQGEPFILPLLYQTETIGQLQLAPRAPNEPFTTADRRLLADIAHQAGIAAHAVRLTSELQRSRERLVTTREEERRRLRRDLHDGLGPTLASMTLKLDAARNLLAQQPAAVDPLLADLKAQMQTTIVDIRRLVYDLRPPALDELGLVSALREQAIQYYHLNGVQVVIEAPPQLPPLPAAVEVAAYRIVMEALTNVARHAQAHTCSVRLTLSDMLTIEVSDDGLGLPIQPQIGIGLASMRERAAELGGTCAITAGATGGVRVLAQLPLAKE
ncbi:MAG TPA: histidine kinase [Ktedonobacterales bacterium]